MNPHGLDEDGHYSTPADLMILARAAMADPFIESTVVNRSITVTISGTERTLGSTNSLLSTYSSVEGIKTGFTRQAGRALLFQVEKNGIELTGAVIGTVSEKERSEQVTKLMDWAYARYPYTECLDVRRFAKTVPYAYRPGWMYDVGIQEAAFGHMDRTGERVTSTAWIPAVLETNANDIGGGIIVKQEGRVISSVGASSYDDLPVEANLSGALALTTR